MPDLTVTASTLNLRASPGLDGRVLLRLPRNFRVVRLDTSPDGKWHRVEAGAVDRPVTGWVSSRYTAAVPVPAPAPSTGELPWMSIARGEIGVAEFAGPADNPRIVEYHAKTSLRASDDEVPWCSSFVNWCMLKAGIAGSGKANARSWLSWGRKIGQPVPGCVVVLSRGADTASGHVGFFVKKTGGSLFLLGGNQGNRVCIAPYAATRLLGYRLPAGG